MSLSPERLSSLSIPPYGRIAAGRTRTPVKVLFENLEAGMNTEEVVESNAYVELLGIYL